MSCQVKVCNDNDKFFSQLKNYWNFNDLVHLNFFPTKTDFAKFEIALVSFKLHLRTDNGEILKKDLPVIKSNDVGLVKVCLTNLSIENYDKCVYLISSTELASGFFEVPRLVYFPIFLMQNNLFNVKLFDEKNQLLWLLHNGQDISDGFIVTCVFHIRPMSLFDVKVLSLNSSNLLDKARFPLNLPYRFSSSVSQEFHQNEDFTLWEVALESLFVSKSMMTKYKSATFLEVTCGDIKFFETYSNKHTSELATFECIYRRNYPATVFRCKNLIFYSVTKRFFDELSIGLNFFNGSKNINLQNDTFTDDCFSIVVLLFRRKIQL